MEEVEEVDFLDPDRQVSAELVEGAVDLVLVAVVEVQEVLEMLELQIQEMLDQQQMLEIHQELL